MILQSGKSRLHTNNDGSNFSIFFPIVDIQHLDITSLIKPLNVATTQDIRMILIMIISTILKYVFSKNSIRLFSINSIF